MNYDNNNIDKKLQQIENQALPDLSKMDEHWQQMRDALKPAAISTKPSSGIGKKFYGWMVAAVVLGLVVFFTYKWTTKPVKENTLAEKKEQGTRDKVQGTRDKGQERIQETDTLLRGSVEEPAKDKEQDEKNQDAGFADYKKPVKSLTIKPFAEQAPETSTSFIAEADKEDKSNTESPSTSAAMLTAFFNAIEKEEQQFVIDNRSDTVITGKDGTALLIPAGTFKANEPVTITMKEYYSYGDIISNKLNTSSDYRMLETGGMVHVVATLKGEEVDIQPGKSIRWFVPDTSASIGQMQLFTGKMVPDKRSRIFPVIDGEGVPKDSLSPFAQYNSIDWAPQSSIFSRNYLVRMVKVLDLRNDPQRTISTKKGLKGIFHISIDSRMSKKEMAALLKEKYGYYKVKVRKQKTAVVRIDRTPSERRMNSLTDGLGDSVWLDLATARQFNLQGTDTIVSSSRIRNKSNAVPAVNNRNSAYVPGGVPITGYLNDTTAYDNSATNPLDYNQTMNSLADRYSVDIRKLGWINCDRFYNDNNPKIDYYVDLQDTASNYYTFLVFKDIRSVMTGYTSGNRVMFQQVPKGLSATLISVGIQNGKPVSAKKDVILSTGPVNGLLFEPTSAGEFKQEVAGLN